MRICILKTTGKLIEMQSAATKGTLIKNALSAGYSETDIEEREITDAEWVDLAAPWNQPTDAQLEAAAEAQRQVLFAEYDLAVKKLTRAQYFGDDVSEDLLAWHTYARELVQMSDVEDWYIDPQWPVKPEMPTGV